MNANGTLSAPMPPPPRPDPFAPDLSDWDAAAPDPAFTPADFPFPMVRDAERWVRKHPLASALTLVSAGVAIGVVVRELLAPDAAKLEQARVKRILDELDASISALREQLGEKDER
jgi:hypothetical protein